MTNEKTPREELREACNQWSFGSRSMDESGHALVTAARRVLAEPDQSERIAELEAEVERLQEHWWKQSAVDVELRRRINDLESREPRAMTEAEREWCSWADCDNEVTFRKRCEGLRESGWSTMAADLESLHAERHPAPSPRTLEDVNVDCMDARDRGKNLTVLQALFDERRRLLDWGRDG